MRMENRAPFITIGIASFNYAKYLPEAFEAIRNQKFQDFEILYCDDGSTDESVEIIKGFMQDNPHMQIRLVEAENGGIVANKNRILDHARGKFLMVCALAAIGLNTSFSSMKKAGIRPMLHGFIISALVVIVALLVEMAMGIV